MSHKLLTYRDSTRVVEVDEDGSIEMQLKNDPSSAWPSKECEAHVRHLINRILASVCNSYVQD